MRALLAAAALAMLSLFGAAPVQAIPVDGAARADGGHTYLQHLEEHGINMGFDQSDSARTALGLKACALLAGGTPAEQIGVLALRRGSSPLMDVHGVTEAAQAHLC